MPAHRYLVPGRCAVPHPRRQCLPITARGDRVVLAPDEVVFLLVDNTLLDNDRFASNFGMRLEQGFGAAGRERWLIGLDLPDFRGVASARAATPTRSRSPWDHT